MGAACVVCQQPRKPLAVLRGVALLLAVLLPVQLEVGEELHRGYAGALVAAGERALDRCDDSLVVEPLAQHGAQAFALGLGQLRGGTATSSLAAAPAELAHHVAALGIVSNAVAGGVDQAHAAGPPGLRLGFAAAFCGARHSARRLRWLADGLAHDWRKTGARLLICRDFVGRNGYADRAGVVEGLDEEVLSGVCLTSCAEASTRHPDRREDDPF